MNHSIPARLLAVAAALFCATALAPAQGRWVRVGPTQTYTTVQQALTFIAGQSNPVDWTILVDPNNTYPGFVINGAAGVQNVSVVSSMPGQQYTLSGANAHVVIRNVFGGQVTVADGNWIYADGSQASIEVTDCVAMVRLRNLDIEQRSLFAGAQVRGVIELTNSISNMLLDVRMWREGSPNGFTQNPNGPNDGLCGLVLRAGFFGDTTALLHEVALYGYHNPFGTYGGDAVRVESNVPNVTANVWITDYLQNCILAGGNGGPFGGSCVHRIQTAMPFAGICGPLPFGMIPGGGSTSAGAELTVDNILPSPSLLPRCPSEQWGHAETPTTAPINATLTVGVDSGFARSFVLYGDLTPFTYPAPSGFSGLLFQNPNSMFQVATGTVSGLGPTPVPMPIPNNTSLIGRQFVFQAALSPANGSSVWALSTPAETTLVP